MFLKKNKDKKSEESRAENAVKQLLAFVLGIMATILYFTDFGTSNLILKDNYKHYQEIDRMVNTIEKNYYENISKDVIYDNMKRGIFSLLKDGYSYYLGPEEYKALIDSSEGMFYGYGLGNLSYTDKEILIGYTMKNSPAKAAGIKDGDAIVEINGEEYSKLGEEKARIIFLNNENPTVKVGIQRKDEANRLYFTMTKGNIEEESVDSKLIGKVGYIHLSQFIADTGKDFAKAVDELSNKGAKSYIVDLRNNGGGLFDEAVVVADRILSKSVITYTENRDGEKKYFNATDEQKLDAAMVVLVNKNSASASELLTAALKDNGAAKVFGTKTFGKGIVQETYKLSSNTGFKLTTKRYRSPNGTQIHKIGVLPDKEIPQDTALKLGSPEDVQLKEALKYLENLK